MHTLVEVVVVVAFVIVGLLGSAGLHEINRRALRRNQEERGTALTRPIWGEQVAEQAVEKRKGWRRWV